MALKLKRLDLLCWSFLITSILLFMGTDQARAQGFKLAGIEYAAFPNVDLKDYTGGASSIQEFVVDFNYPIALKNKKTFLVNRLSYAPVQINFQKQDMYDSNQTYHRIGYSFTMIHILNDDWLFLGQFSPSLSSDLNANISNGDYILTGLGLASKKIHTDLRVGGGLVYTTRLRESLILPLIQFSLEKEKQYLDIILPAWIKYGHYLGSNKKWVVGLKTEITSGEFNTEIDYQENPDIDRLNYFRINAGPLLKHRISKMLELEISGGVSTTGEFRVKNPEGDINEYPTQNSGFFNVGFSIVAPG